MPPLRMRGSVLLLFTSVGMLLGATTAFAADLDLTTAGSSGSFGAGFFQQVDPQATGTGIIDPFVRMSANGQEQGFNTDHTPLQGDLQNVKPGRWTHSVLVGDLTPVLCNGVLSIRFLLDVDETGARPLISLDELKVFTAPDPDLSSNAALFAENLVYDMGAGNRVLLNYSLNSGSGSGDMFFCLPADLFTGLDDQFLYLYSKFGASGGDFTSDDGFEEWALVIETVPVDQSTWSKVKVLYRQ